MVYHALSFSVFISLFLLRKVAGRPLAGKKTGRGRDLPHRETRLFDREISLHLPSPAVRIPFFLHLLSSASSITLAPFTSPFLSLFSSQSLSSSLQCFSLFLTNRPYFLSLKHTHSHIHTNTCTHSTISLFLRRSSLSPTFERRLLSFSSSCQPTTRNARACVHFYRKAHHASKS